MTARSAMVLRLKDPKPRVVYGVPQQQQYIYTDAAYESLERIGGLGGVLVDGDGKVQAWFGIPMDVHRCVQFGSQTKESLIYELELLAAVVSLCLWSRDSSSCVQVWFGDNDSVRYTLIKASAAIDVSQKMLAAHAGSWL